MMQNFKEWLAQPYRDDMDAMGWFLFLGLLILISFLWAIILSHMKEL